MQSTRNWIKLGLKLHGIGSVCSAGSSRNWIKLGLKLLIEHLFFDNYQARNWIKLGLKRFITGSLPAKWFFSQLD